MITMERKKTMTMNWDGLRDYEDDDEFFESKDRASSAVPLDLLDPSSSDDDDDFNDSRMSFTSSLSSVRKDVDLRAFVTPSTSASASPPSSPPSSSTSSAQITPDYNIWMAAPGSITERRKRLLQGMGLADGPGKALASFKQLNSIKRLISNKIPNGVFPMPRSVTRAKETAQAPPDQPEQEAEPEPEPEPEPLPVVLVRSRSESDIEAFSVDKQRKEKMIGRISKQRLTRTSSAIAAPRSRICPYTDLVRASPNETGVGGATPASASSRSVRSGGGDSLMYSNNQVGAFFLIKNLDTGTEFIVNEYDQDGGWNRFSDLQTGKQLTVDEFEKCVGYSPVVKEVMRRQNVSNDGGGDRKFGVGANSFVSKSLRMSKRRGVALLKNSMKGVGTAVSVLIREKDKETPTPTPTPPLTPPDQKSGKSAVAASEWIKVRLSGKQCKELSALHLCQEIQAHEGSIWTIKFSLDARFLASAGEDRVIHVWEVQECEIMSLDGNSTPLHHSFGPSTPERTTSSLSDQTALVPVEKKKKGKGGTARKSNPIPEYVHVPETVFSFSEKPFCSFEGHLDAVLDLSWSRDQLLLSSSMDKTVRLWDLETKTCLKLFAHNDYVTCIDFSPVDDNYFISGSLDAKIRLWNVPVRQVVDWTDLHEMVTAASFTPDGQACLIGSNNGNCHMFSTEDCKLNEHSQIDIQNKKKSQAKKITGFQFSPINPSEMLITSADSRIRIFDGTNVTHKFRGFRNTSSQIGASFSENGKYVICASEDSQVYVWKRHDPRTSGAGKKSIINSNSHEHFPCKDVSVAIPWPGTVKGDPPPVPVPNSKKKSKRSSQQQQPPSGNASPTQEDAVASKRSLPPLPKKNNNSKGDALDQRPSTPPPEEQDPAQISRTESGIGESFNSDPSSIRYSGDASMSAGSASTASWASSMSWDNIGNNSNATQTTHATAWGLVIVTATLEGEIRAYQNFGLPRKVQNNIFGGPT